MFSLYRAWLTLGPCGGMPPLPPPLPAPLPLNLSVPHHQASGAPDVTLRVGPAMTHFSAHRAILSAHSGFFKAALSNHTDSTIISVPNVNVDDFSSLLTFMYTGYLDLNVANIYNILLATHVLHMPRALDVCRSFLVHTQPTRQLRTNVIKPIASRMEASPSQEMYTPTSSEFRKSADTPFRAPAKAATSATADVERKTPKQRKRQARNADDVVVDIACCDGPVKFHRVVNRNYGLAPAADARPDEVNRNAALNAAMNENIKDQLHDDENRNGEVFTCLYCKHTFKSQYCYRKHARRHLNPVCLEAKGGGREAEREVKLLDMNVQYYPCKTCGSKFPSYYFVHKHRKLCHAEEMADNDNKNNEMVAENAENTNSSCSAIDVEAVNADV